MIYQVCSAYPGRFWVVQDKSSAQEDLEFHVQANDYFGTLATIVSLLHQSLESCRRQTKTPSQAHIQLLQKLQKDLEILQKNYRIRHR